MLRRKGAVIGQPDARGRDPERAPARIQPENNGVEQDQLGAGVGDLDAALTALEGDLDEAVRRAAQRLADAQLRDRLAEEGFSGPLWRTFQMDAAEYGIAVFMRWVGTGEVYTRAAARRRVVNRPTRELTYEERRGLVNLVVAHGLRYFRQGALVAGRWSADGGAALKTFFIGACLLQFKAAFEAWRPDSMPEEIALDELDLVQPWIPPASPQPADEVVLRERTWDVVNGAEDAITKSILVCIAAGMNYPQTAAAIGGGLTDDAVCARVQRIRDKHKPDPAVKGRPS
jgi:hypothetical protein